MMGEKAKSTAGKLLASIFLVAGTCVGGGMLALPVATGINGFLPSVGLLFISWAMMTLTALFLLEICLFLPADTHVMTMAGNIIGPKARYLVWILFPFMSYASLIGYTAGGGVTIAAIVQKMVHLPIDKITACMIFTVIFGTIICLGARLVGKINSMLFIAMIGAYLALITMGGNEVDTDRLQHIDWSGAYFAFPLLLTSFSFQSFLIPTLTTYLERDRKTLLKAIVGGSILTLAVYLAWMWLVLGSVPVEGTAGLAIAFLKGEPATEYLRQAVQSPIISSLAEYFAFFALVTSFLGMGLGLFDFFVDEMKIPRNTKGSLLIGILIAIPTIVCAVFFERAFLVAFDISGGFGDTLLNGILPIMMVWILLKQSHKGFQSTAVINKPILVITALFFLFILILEIVVTFGLLG